MPWIVIPENPGSETQPPSNALPSAPLSRDSCLFGFVSPSLMQSRRQQGAGLPGAEHPFPAFSRGSRGSFGSCQCLGWVCKSFLTGPVGDSDASPRRELWKMVSGSGLAWLGWHSPHKWCLIPYGFSLLCPQRTHFTGAHGVSNPQNPHGTEIINPNPAPFPPLFPQYPIWS